MKKWIVVFLGVLFMVMAFAPAAFAESAPPSNAKKGAFTSVDPASRTGVFQAIDADEPINLKLADSINASEIKLDDRVMVTLSDDSGSGQTATDISSMFIGLTPDKLVALLVVGLIGGLLSGFIGSGGAFVLTPSMMSLGAPGAVAVASNMCHKFPKAMVGTYKRFKYGQVDVKLGLFMGLSAVVGVEIGIRIQEKILETWGSAASDLYVSFVFVIILVIVGGLVLRDAAGGDKSEKEQSHKMALAMQKIKIPPMVHFKKADVVLSVWVTVPIGFATGLLAATIAVGGFIGVPGMIYMVGASALVASATELLVAFIMGMVGSVEWAMSGLVDIRLTLLILAASLFGVQLGAIGTTYVKDHTIKLVMAAVMLIVAVSRGVKVPVYMSKLGIISISSGTADILNKISFWTLILALLTAGLIITSAMVKGIILARTEENEANKALAESA